jgi:hypothetical protein
MYVCVLGTLTNNGEINMTGKGADAEGQDVYLLKNEDDSWEYVPAARSTRWRGYQCEG